MKRLTFALAVLFIVVSAFAGINNTLNEAQSLFQKAATEAQYEAAKKKFRSAKLDVGYVAAEHDNAINEGIRKCDKKLNELRLRTADNSSSAAKRVSNPSSSSSSSRDSSSSSSTTTSGNSKQQPSTPGVIKRVWIDQNSVSENKKGVTIHLNFDVKGMKDHDCRATAYFYSGGEPIRDLNGAYCTAGDDKVVASGTDFKPGYDNTSYEDLTIFIPYGELHQSGTYARDLSFDIVLWDNSVDPHEQIGRKDDTFFSYTPRYDTYLTVDGKTATSSNYSGEGETETFYISTDASSWSTWGVPTWCEITEKTNGSFTLRCKPNRGAHRTDYMKIKTDNHEVRIDITQEGGDAAVIDRVWVDFDVYNGGQKGMMIHMDFVVYGLKDHRINPIAYFYFSNGDKLKDYDNSYRASDGHVCVSDTSNATYEDTRWSDYKLFMPYDQLHMASGKHELKFFIHINDKTTDEWIGMSDWVNFTFSK